MARYGKSGLLLILSNYIHNSIYYELTPRLNAMSHETPPDEEVAIILEAAGSNDSSGEDKPKKKVKANDEFNEYETNTIESPDSEW